MEKLQNSGGSGGIRTRGGFNTPHAFQACDLNRSSTDPWSSILAGLSGPHRIGADGNVELLLPACTIRMAEAIKADVSVMLLGTMRVVLASAATLL